jgi:hypothetical protein
LPHVRKRRRQRTTRAPEYGARKCRCPAQAGAPVITAALYFVLLAILLAVLFSRM